MSIDFFEISFSAKNSALAEVVKQYASRRNKSNCALNVEDNVVCGNYYSSEYDEEWDGWEPTKKLPGGSNTVKWLLDVMNHGALITEAGVKHAENNLKTLEDGVEGYEVMFCKCVPEAFGENVVFFQRCDGDQIVSYELGALEWEELWSSRNRDKAKEIFERYGLDMKRYNIKDSFVGDTLSYLKDKPVFMELMENFGKRTTTKKAVGNEVEQLKNEIQELLDDLDQWVVSPETIDYVGKTVGIGVYPSNLPKRYTSWGDRMRLRYFVESSVAQLGGTTNTSTVNSKVDVSILVRNPEDYTTDYQICRYYGISEIEKVTFVYGGENIREKLLTDKEYCIGKLAVFKEYLESFTDKFNNYNRKRLSAKKPKPPINIVFEDQWFEYIAKLDNSNMDYHKERQRIAKDMVVSSPYIGGDEERINAVYDARLEGRDFEL